MRVDNHADVPRSIQIREAREADVPQLWELMRDLAVFERYIDAFAVTEEFVREQGFRRSPAAFHSLVAQQGEALVGMVVYYFLPFTAMARPTLFIKELFVRDEVRSRGVGSKLMRAVAQVAEQTGCGAVKWQVAPWNEAGLRFYERLGGRLNTDWVDFGLDGATISALATNPKE